jgi:hypothetical protein
MDLRSRWAQIFGAARCRHIGGKHIALSSNRGLHHGKAAPAGHAHEAPYRSRRHQANARRMPA